MICGNVHIIAQEDWLPLPMCMMGMQHDTVMKCQNQGADGSNVLAFQATGAKRACKIIRRWDEQREPDHRDRRKLVLREIAVLTQLEAHPSIVHLLDAYETDTNFYLVLELCSGGELFEAITKQVCRSIGFPGNAERDAICIRGFCIPSSVSPASSNLWERWREGGPEGAEGIGSCGTEVKLKASSK